MVPEAFDYPVRSIERIETHISWVILTDEYAYKIKKPLELDFLNFGDLERRKFYCDEEIRLNRPWAPHIYLGVVAITETDGRISMEGDGTPIEYAVKMRRFDQDLRLDRQLLLGKLTVADMRDLAQAVAARHAAAAVIESGLRERVLSMTVSQMRDNFAALKGHLDEDMLASLEHWTESHLDLFNDLLARRFDEGFVRDCHGDLHLANLVRLPDGIKTFDCIEFNEDLRRIDTICDIAFLAMDLVAKGRRELAAHFLNRYLECCGDYDGVALLDLYFVYRCLVRAKVAVIGSRESSLENDRLRNIADADRYCRIALRQTRKADPLLVIMSGMSGSGKTWVSGQLMATLPAVRIRSDIERKRMCGLDETADSESGIAGGMYTSETSQHVYQQLRARALPLLQARHNVIIDAAFLDAKERGKALQMARGCGFHAVIVQVNAPQALMRSRIIGREEKASDASEAGLAVLDHQLSTTRPFTAQELSQTIVFDNVDGSDLVTLTEKIRNQSRLPTPGLLPGVAKQETA